MMSKQRLVLCQPIFRYVKRCLNYLYGLLLLDFGRLFLRIVAVTYPFPLGLTASMFLFDPFKEYKASEFRVDKESVVCFRGL